MVDWAAIRDEALAGFTMLLMAPKVQLPALPHAVTLFVERSGDETVPLKELAEILETDSGLTIELLDHVNSSFLCSKPRPEVSFKPSQFWDASRAAAS